MRGKHHHDEEDRLKRIEQEEAEILRVEKDIEDRLRRAQSATLTIYASNLIINLQRRMDMPATLAVGKTATAVYQEWSLPGGTGVKLPPAGPVVFATSDGSIATVDQTGLVTAVAAGTATITGSDATNGLNASDTVTVTGAAAQSATLVITPN